MKILILGGTDPVDGSCSPVDGFGTNARLCLAVNVDATAGGAQATAMTAALALVGLTLPYQANQTVAQVALVDAVSGTLPGNLVAPSTGAYAHL